MKLFRKKNPQPGRPTEDISSSAPGVVFEPDNSRADAKGVAAADESGNDTEDLIAESDESGSDAEDAETDSSSAVPPTRTGTGEALTGRSRRGVVGEQWWAHRWCDLLAEAGRSDRLHRGRVLARTGNVFGFRIEVGSMRGEVRQSRAELHEAILEIAPWTPDELTQVLAETARRARYGAALLAGTLDLRLEEALIERGVHLFPRSFHDLTASCTCPEEVQPCPHVAALVYLYAERIDRNPFLLLRLRGIRREPLLEECRQRRAPAGTEMPQDGESESPLDEEIDRTEGRSRAEYFGDEQEISKLDPRALGEEPQVSILEELGLPPRVEAETFSALAVTDAYQHIQTAVERLLGENAE